MGDFENISCKHGPYVCQKIIHAHDNLQKTLPRARKERIVPVLNQSHTPLKSRVVLPKFPNLKSFLRSKTHGYSASHRREWVQRTACYKDLGTQDKQVHNSID